MLESIDVWSVILLEKLLLNIPNLLSQVVSLKLSMHNIACTFNYSVSSKDFKTTKYHKF